MSTETTTEKVRIPAMSTFSNFWYNVSKLTVTPNVSKDTMKYIQKALEIVAPTPKSKPEGRGPKETPRKYRGWTF